MGCGIYFIKNIVNNKIYIGSSFNIENRRYKHFWLLKNNIHDNKYLQNSYNKYGEKNFIFDVIEECNEEDIINKENHYIDYFNSNDLKFGYNLAKVNEFRRNKYNYSVKKQLSEFGLNKNGNFSEFKLINISTNKEYLFNNLVDASIYLIDNNFTTGKPEYVRMKISNALRGKKVNNGSKGSIRKTIYKHKFEIIK